MLGDGWIYADDLGIYTDSAWVYIDLQEEDKKYYVYGSVYFKDASCWSGKPVLNFGENELLPANCVHAVTPESFDCNYRDGSPSSPYIYSVSLADIENGFVKYISVGSYILDFTESVTKWKRGDNFDESVLEGFHEMPYDSVM